MKPLPTHSEETILIQSNRPSVWWRLFIFSSIFVLGLWTVFQIEALVFLVVYVLLLLSLLRYVIWLILILIEQSSLIIFPDKLLLRSKYSEMSLYWEEIKALTVRSAFGAKGVFITFFDLDSLFSRPDLLVGSRPSPFLWRILYAVYDLIRVLDIFILLRGLIRGNLLTGRKLELNIQGARKTLKEAWQLNFDSFGHHFTLHDMYQGYKIVELGRLMEEYWKQRVTSQPPAATETSDEVLPEPLPTPLYTRQQLTDLVLILGERFSKEELRTLCFSLGVEYEDLPAEGKANKARELAAHCQRRNEIETLRSLIQRLRPDITFP